MVNENKERVTESSSRDQPREEYGYKESTIEAVYVTEDTERMTRERSIPGDVKNGFEVIIHVGLGNYIGHVYFVFSNVVTEVPGGREPEFWGSIERNSVKFDPGEFDRPVQTEDSMRVLDEWYEPIHDVVFDEQTVEEWSEGFGDGSEFRFEVAKAGYLLVTNQYQLP